MDRYHAAYLRRSEEGGITKDDEAAALRALAGREGHNGDLVWYDDWGHSADEAKDAQRELTRLLADMKAGKVATVYAGKIDRLARSVAVFARFAAIAREHDVRLVTVQEGDMSEARAESDPFAWGSRQFMVTMAEMELRTIKARVHRAQRVRRDRGDKMGRPPYGYRFGRDASGRVILEAEPSEPVAPVLDAYREAGTFAGAARILNAAGIPARHAPSWAGNVVRRVVRHALPEVAREVRKPGRRARHVWTLAGLLRCQCGALLTARETMTMTPYGRFGPYVGYQCPKGRYDAAHPRPYMIAETAILPAIREEVARMSLPVDAVALGDAPDLGAERAELVASRARLALAFARGGLPEDTYTAEDAALEARLEELGEREEAETIAPVSPIRPEEWDTWSPADLNAYLRAILRRVRLGPDLRPLPFRPDDWRNPALRS